MSKSKIAPKSYHSEHPFINPPTRMTLPANIPQNPKTIKLACHSQTSLTPIPWSEGKETGFRSFVEHVGEQQQQQRQVIADREKITQERERIKPLLVEYLRRYSFLDTKKYNILPYVMGNVFGNLPDGYRSDMLHLCGYRYFIQNSNREMDYIEIPIDVDVLNGHSDNIQVINYNTTPRLIIKVRELQGAFNTVNKLDFSRNHGGKHNKKQQSKSMRSHASTKCYKHYRKSFTLKNVK